MKIRILKDCSLGNYIAEANEVFEYDDEISKKLIKYGCAEEVIQDIEEINVTIQVESVEEFREQQSEVVKQVSKAIKKAKK